MIKENEPETKQNIWQDILTEANTNKDLEESHLFIFGDKTSGKKNLIKSINKELFLNYENEEKNLLQSDDNNSKYALVDAKYLNIKKTNDPENGKPNNHNSYLHQHH